jgi:hypothetical protein
MQDILTHVADGVLTLTIHRVEKKPAGDAYERHVQSAARLRGLTDAGS